MFDEIGASDPDATSPDKTASLTNLRNPFPFPPRQDLNHINHGTFSSVTQPRDALLPYCVHASASRQVAILSYRFMGRGIN